MKNTTTDKGASSASLLTRDEAAAYLAVKPRTLRTWANERSDGPPWIQVGAQFIRYRRTDLDAWLDQHTHRGDAA